MLVSIVTIKADSNVSYNDGNDDDDYDDDDDDDTNKTKK